MPPLRKKGYSHPSSSTRTSTPASGSRRRLPVPLLAAPSLEPAAVLALADIVSRGLQQSVLWRRSVGRTLERTPGITWRSVPLLRSSYPPIHAITWVLLQESSGEEWPEAATRTLRELCQQKIGWTLNDAAITDRSRIINIDGTVLQDVASARTRVARQRRTARRHGPCSSPPGIVVPDVYAQLIFQGKTSAVEPATPYPSLLTTSHSESHCTTPTTLTAFRTWLDTT